MFNSLVILLSILSLVFCQVPGNYHQTAQGAAILSDARYLAGDGTFGAAYSQEDGVEFKEESDVYGNRKGSYSYVDPTGQRRTVSYTAGKDGFRPVGDHIPAAPSQIPPQPEYVPLAQYNPPDYQFPQQFAQSNFPQQFAPRSQPYSPPFFNEFGGGVKPEYYPLQRGFNPNYPIQSPYGRPIAKPQEVIPRGSYQPFGRPFYQPDRSFSRHPLDKPEYHQQQEQRPIPDPLHKQIPDSVQRPIYQPVPTGPPVSPVNGRPTPTPPLPKSIPDVYQKPFPPALNRPYPAPRPQSHYSPEYLAQIYPEYRSSGLESIGKAGPQYNGVNSQYRGPQYNGASTQYNGQAYGGPTTAAPRKFNPPGKLEFNRTPDGFSYTFNKT